MRKIQQTEQGIKKGGDHTIVKDYEHTGVSQADRKMYTYFKTAKEKGVTGVLPTTGPMAGKTTAQKEGHEYSEQMFSFLGGADLESLIAAGGKKGKGAAPGGAGGKGNLEKVDYMQKDEIMKVHQKNKEERKQRRAMVDGVSNINNVLDTKSQANAFEVSDE